MMGESRADAHRLNQVAAPAPVVLVWGVSPIPTYLLCGGAWAPPSLIQDLYQKGVVGWGVPGKGCEDGE